MKITPTKLLCMKRFYHLNHCDLLILKIDLRLQSMRGIIKTPTSECLSATIVLD